jgi:hypothetical protein
MRFQIIYFSLQFVLSSGLFSLIKFIYGTIPPGGKGSPPIPGAGGIPIPGIGGGGGKPVGGLGAPGPGGSGGPPKAGGLGGAPTPGGGGGGAIGGPDKGAAGGPAGALGRLGGGILGIYGGAFYTFFNYSTYFSNSWILFLNSFSPPELIDGAILLFKLSMFMLSNLASKSALSFFKVFTFSFSFANNPPRLSISFYIFYFKS